MLFKVMFETKPMYLEANETIEFFVKRDKWEVQVVLEKIEDADLKQGQLKKSVRCSVQTEVHLLPAEVLEVQREKGEGDRATGEAIEEIEQMLRGVAERTVLFYRWCRGVSEIHDPIQYRFGLFYSIDGSDWKPAHGMVKVSLVLIPGLGMQQVSAEFIAVLANEVEGEIPQPLGHELFAEAWTLRKTNRRSALVIGLSALEAGFKEMVADLEPGAAWLIENAPSPQMEVLLTKYMPTLSSRALIRGNVPQLSGKAIDVIHDAVSLRNKVAHGVRRPIDASWLEGFLKTLRSVLYLFDVYRGHVWAERFIDRKIIKDLSKKK